MQFSTIKRNINVFKSVKDLKMLMHSTIELGKVLSNRAFLFFRGKPYDPYYGPYTVWAL
jgi:hypothetical protein